MTDLLARPTADASENDQSTTDTETKTGTVTSDRPSVAREHWVAAAALVGAGAIHVAMAPSHLGESAVEGAGFLAAAWVQLSLAVAVVLRPTRRVMAAVGVSSVVLIAIWAVSRTAGLPFGAHSGHAESVSLVDGVCVALEVVAWAATLGLLTRVARIKGAALVGGLAALAFATAAVASPSARDHASASHGDHGQGAMAGDGGGHDHGAGAGSEEADDLGFAQLSNGHQHEHATDEPLTPDETVQLAGQLASTADLVAQFPTIADAEAAGWRRAGPFAPGLGTHYQSPNFATNPDGDMDPQDLATPMLVFDGLEPDAPIAGFMYIAYGTDSEPTGFAGPNDHWHYHERVCIVQGEGGVIDTPFGADLEGVTEQMCSDVGGDFISFTGYMVHVWNVPGYESPDGMFTELNPRITCPDGTYYRIPLAEIGTKDTTCQNT